MVRQRLQIKGMHCVGCAMSVDGALEDIAGVRSVRTNFARQFADVEYDEKRVTLAQLIMAVEEAGYQAALAAPGK